MDDEAAVSSVSSIRHDPVIQKASDYHKNTEDEDRARFYGQKTILIVVMLIMGFVCQMLPETAIDITSNSLFALLSFCKFMFYAIAAYHIFTIFFLVMERVSAHAGREGNFVAGLLNKNSSLLSFTLVCFLFSYYIGLDLSPAPAAAPAGDGSAPAPAPAEEPADPASAGSMKILDYLSSFYMAMGMSTGIFLLKDILIYALSYNVHFFYYSERIEKNNDKVNLLKTLNAVVSAGYSDDADVICSKLISSISKESGTVTYANAKQVLTEEDADKLFYYMYLDKNKDAIELSDLSQFYRKTLFEQEQLAEGLTQKNSSVDNLNIVATFICVLLSVSIFFSELNPDKGSKNQIAIIMTGLATGGYIFADIIKKYIGSLLFVFFIRPFEIGDAVIIDGHVCKVKEINILTTTLLQDQLVVISPNSKLIDSSITNLRLSKAYDVSYGFTFNVEEYKSREKELKERLDEHVTSMPDVFRKHAYFKDPTILDANTMAIAIVVSFNMEDIRIRKLRENQEQFVLDLNAIFKKVGLNPSKK